MSDHQQSIAPIAVPQNVTKRADALGLGPFAIRFQHPNRRMHAIFWWFGAVMFFGMVAPAPFVSTTTWDLTTIILILVFGGVAALCGYMAIGAYRKQAFYFSEQGMVLTRSSGAIRFASTWRDIDGVYLELYQFQLVILFWALPRRYNASIVTRGRRRLKYVEVDGKVAVTPVAQLLHEAAR
ncbi:hypothetical protein [Alloactinosynnema sp. L-07]|uniref:hypothetical protein n=1 Tax=Alloactinosynnema sp. L-07 TaxID=1653480 RepID=UPI0006B42D0C|nr:hypothetical protein [Alloactinosynnema sp. L-07]